METLQSPNNDTVWSYLKSVANKRRTFDDPLYAEGNKACAMQLQHVVVDVDDEELLHSSSPAPFQCEVVGCGRWLGSVYEQEVHYNASHRHSCSVCRAQLPSFHQLQLHLEESHDSLFQLRAEKQAMYRCLVESCATVCVSADARRLHCAADHCFPADFRYQPRPPTADLTPPAPRPAGGVRPRLRFSYTVPTAAVSFGAAAVASFRRDEHDNVLGMAGLAAALEPETL